MVARRHLLDLDEQVTLGAVGKVLGDELPLGVGLVVDALSAGNRSHSRRHRCTSL
jgi:hypothetical protein